MLKRLLLFTLVIFAVVTPSTYFISHYYRFLKEPLNQTQAIHIVFEPGASAHRLLADLQSQGYIKQPRFFLLLAYLKGTTNKLKTGEYRFDPGITPGQLLDQMLAGRVILHHFTIVEGWTLQQLMTALNALPYVKHKLHSVPKEQLRTELGLSKQNPEGLFFPATYYFSLGLKDSHLLKWSHQLLEKKLNAAWKLRDATLPYKNSYDALIVASLIEKETALPQERSMIAGVITRRLKMRIPLQIDASVIYGLGAAYRNNGKLTLEDLHKDTPYNTYIHLGLPPTPIANPGFKSIEAALHPDHTQNLYFVARGDGTHQFSVHLAEHDLAVQRYQLDSRYPYLKKKNKYSSAQNLWYISKSMRSLLYELSSSI